MESDAVEEHLKLQRATPIPTTWPEGPTPPANVKCGDIRAQIAEATGEDDASPASEPSSKGGTRLTYRPHQTGTLPPSDAGARPVVGKATAQCGKPSVAPRTPAMENKWQQLAAVLGEVASLAKRPGEHGACLGVPSDYPMIHKWQTRHHHIRAAWNRRGCVRHPPDTDWAVWLRRIVDLSSAKADVVYATELQKMAKANARRIVAGEVRRKTAAFRDWIRRAATGYGRAFFK